MPGPTDRLTQSLRKKDTADDQSFGVGVIRFHLLQKCRKFANSNGKERTRVLCSRDVKQMNIGSLADESG